MNDQNNIESRLSAIRLTTSSTLDERVRKLIGQETKAGAERDTAPAKTSRAGSYWRMGIGIAAAVIVTLAAIYFIRPQQKPHDTAVAPVITDTAANGSEAKKNIAALSGAFERSKRSEWVHMTVTGEESGEMWISFKPTRLFMSDKNRTEMWNGSTHKRWQFDPASNTITILDFADSELPLPQAANMGELILKQLDQGKESGDITVDRTEEISEGRKQVVFIVKPKDQPAYGRFVMDAEGEHVLRAETVFNDKSVKPTTVEFEYPSKGPADIYALGVPRDAKVLNKEKGWNAVKLLEQVNKSKKKFPKQYVGAVVWTEPHNVKGDIRNVANVFITYKKNGAVRTEQRMPNNDDLQNPKVPQSLEEVFEWAKTHPAIRVEFADRNQTDTAIEMKKPGELSKRVFKKWPFEPTDSVEQVMWDMCSVLSTNPAETEMLPEEDGEGGKLIGIQRTLQGEIRKGDFISLPQRAKAFLNPVRDWLPERSEIVWDADAPWQTNKDWAKGEDLGSDKKPSGHNRTVERYARTPQGNWYPEVIRDNEMVYLIYIDTSREIPDEMMDPEKVTTDLFDQKAAKRQQRFDEAIARIDAQETWPETAEAVAQAYLDAGNAGDWEKVDLYRPGFLKEYGGNYPKPGNYAVGEVKEKYPFSGGMAQVIISFSPARYGMTTMSVTNKFGEKHRYYVEWGPY